MLNEKNLKLPKIKGEALLHVDATPTPDYPLRILKAHRQNCNLKWSSSSTLGENEETDPLCIEMNKVQDERAKVLDLAIEILEKRT